MRESETQLGNDYRPMKIVIIGAGVVGVTQAYVLAARGHHVTIVDRGPAVASETSFANGAQLSYCYHEPIASPYNLRMMSKWLADIDGPLVLNDSLKDWNFLKWGFAYWRACSRRKSQRAGVSLLNLGLYSRRVMEKIINYSGVDFCHFPEGVIQIYSDPKELDRQSNILKRMSGYGVMQEVLDRAGCERIEPVLEQARKPFVGGIYSSLDASGDPFLFTHGLMDAAKAEYDVRLRLNTEVDRVVMKKKQVHAVRTMEGEEIIADVVILAAGSYTPSLMKDLRLSLPMQPMKGYSLTFDADFDAPRISITDVSKRVVHTRLGDKMRVAGFAEFAGHNTQIPNHRIIQLKKAATDLFAYGGITRAEPWACLRAATHDGLPVLGFTQYNGLLLNTGHGMLGWTQAAGCAQILADMIDGKQPEISADPYGYKRLC